MVGGVQDRYLLEAYLRLLDSLRRQRYLIGRLVPDGLVHAKVVTPGGVVNLSKHTRVSDWRPPKAVSDRFADPRMGYSA